MHRNGSVLVLLVALAVGGCGSSVGPSEALPERSCAGQEEMAPEHCRRLVATAIERLGWLHWPITGVTHLPMCPPNARCGFPAVDERTVVIWFLVGDPVMVAVGVVGADAAGLILAAEEPEPVPPALLELLEAPS